MKKILIILILLPMIAYSQANDQIRDFNDKIVDFAIENCENEFIELPNLYDNLATQIANDNDEKLLLVEKLKVKGFKQINWGRGNNPPFGPRIISITLKKESCECEVVKIYYSTTNNDEYIMTEKIKCKKASL